MLNKISIYSSLIAGVLSFGAIIFGYGLPITESGRPPSPGTTDLWWSRYVALGCICMCVTAFITGVIGLFISEKKHYGVCGIVLSMLAFLYLMVKVTARHTGT